MIGKIEQRLFQLESLVAAFSLFLLLVLSLLQILTRNLFGFGFPEIDIINRHLLVVCGAMGAVLATSRLRHIKVDVLHAFMTDRQTRLLRCPIGLFSAVVSFAMSYYAGVFVLDEWEYTPANERWALPFNLVYPAGFGLIGLHFMLLCLKRDPAA